MLLRGLVTTLISLYAAVPPGFCLCRLQEAVSPPHHDCSDPAHDHEDEEDCCDCGQLKPDCIRSSSAWNAPSALAAGPLWLAAAQAESDPPSNVPLGLARPHHASDSPLYLTLRALRI